MIDIDRHRSASVQEQLAEQLRYLIASGRFSPGETLPGTRVLADKVDVSFHTVRKAYQQLRQEGLLDVQPGKGYVVQQRSALGKDARMERGADIASSALRKLIGLGLHPAEIQSLVREQLDLLDATPRSLKLLFAGSYAEQARDCAKQVSDCLQRPIEAACLDELDQHRDADFVFTRYDTLQHVAQQIPRSETVGVVVHPDPSALQRLARLSDEAVVGLVTRYADALQPLIDDVRAHAGFAGQVLGTSFDDDAADKRLRSLSGEINFWIYTPLCRRRVEAMLEDSDERSPRAALQCIVSADSLDAIRGAVPAYSEG